MSGLGKGLWLVVVLTELPSFAKQTHTLSLIVPLLVKQMRPLQTIREDIGIQCQLDALFDAFVTRRDYHAVGARLGMSKYKVYRTLQWNIHGDKTVPRPRGGLHRKVDREIREFL